MVLFFISFFFYIHRTGKLPRRGGHTDFTAGRTSGGRPWGRALQRPTRVDADRAVREAFAVVRSGPQVCADSDAADRAAARVPVHHHGREPREPHELHRQPARLLQRDRPAGDVHPLPEQAVRPPPRVRQLHRGRLHAAAARPVAALDRRAAADAATHLAPSPLRHAPPAQGGALRRQHRPVRPRQDVGVRRAARQGAGAAVRARDVRLRPPRLAADAHRWSLRQHHQAAAARTRVLPRRLLRPWLPRLPSEQNLRLSRQGVRAAQRLHQPYPLAVPQRRDHEPTDSARQGHSPVAAAVPSDQ